jgi:hypothetical protein
LKRPRLVFLAAAVTLAIAAAVIAVSGGFRTTVGGFRVSMRSPLAAGVGALLAGAAWFFLARRDQTIAADLESWWLAIDRHATRIIAVIALVSAIIASTFATRSAAGADASGYLSQANTLAMHPGYPPVHLELLAEDAPELDGWISTPLGWRPYEDACHIDCVVGAQVPTYPPGLPLLMAIPHAIAGIAGANAIVIASAAIAVWATGMLAGGASGVLAALLLAFAPAFLYQSIQPMSDVPVTAAWLVCFLLLVRGRASWLAGVACALAVLIRPNLAPLAIVPLLIAHQRVLFAIPVAVAGVFLALLQWMLYGSPIRSGYGSAAELFALSNAVPNVQRYFAWLISTSPVLLAAPFGFVRVNGARQARALGAFASLVVVAYLIYAVFDQWSYLRFLLPALAVFAVFAAVALAAWTERWPMSWRAPLLLALMLFITAHGLFVARSRGTFKLAEQVRRVEQVASFLSGYSAERPVVISGEQSGAIRYYTMTSILRWDLATPEALNAAIGAVEREGYSTYIVLDAWEEEPFRKKFASVPEVQLDWPPMVEAGESHRTKLWRVSDRAKFLAGERVETLRIP